MLTTRDGVRPQFRKRASARSQLKVAFPTLSLEAGLSQHLLKLASRPHVDRLCDQLALAIVDKTFRDSFDDECVIHFPSGIEQNRITNLLFFDERSYLAGVLIRDR